MNVDSSLGQETKRRKPSSNPLQLHRVPHIKEESRLGNHGGLGAQARSFLAYLAFQETTAPNSQTMQVSARESNSNMQNQQTLVEAYVPFPIFDGTGDPIKFMRAFSESLQKLHISSEKIKSNYRQFFWDSMRGEARHWMMSGSLDKYPPEEFQWVFLKRYASQIKGRRINRGPPENKQSEEKLRVHPGEKKFLQAKKSEKREQLWCNHHKKSGHKTEECRDLRNNLVATYKRNLGDKARSLKGSADIYEDIKDLESEQDVNPYPCPRDSNPRITRGRINMITTDKEIAGYLPDQNQEARTVKDFQKELVFTADDLEGIEVPHSDLLVITLRISDQLVPRILVDTGSTSDLISVDTLQKIWSRDIKIKPRTKNLSSLGGENIPAIGLVKLPVSVGGTLRIVEFDVIEKGMIYNVILGTPWLFSMKAVVSTFHQCLKFPTSEGVYTVKGNQAEARRCLEADRIFQPIRKPEHDVRTPKETLATITQISDELALTLPDKNPDLGKESNKRLRL